ncbi:MAG: amidase family protein [Actinomycetota bacterium]|nr:amidase family protein [Actinomycetota bacterium]
MAALVPAGMASATPSQAEAAAFDPYGATAVELSEALTAGETSSVALIEHYLARIDAYDDDGPMIGAITQVSPFALEDAAASDARRAAGAALGPLDGIPIVVKDNIDVAGMVTTAGSVALAGNYRAEDAPVISRLREAGVIVLARTNMSELAASFGRLGYSSVGGLTLNPVDLRRNASGSSSGSAAAVAAGFAPMALGTDTSGSVRGPAASVGAVGIRGTLGAVPIDGVVPLSTNLDVVGPIAATATDAALLYSVIADRPELTDAAVTGPIDGMRVGVVEQFSSANPEVGAAVGSTVATLEALGATVVPVTLSEAASYAWTEPVGPLSELDFVHDVEAYLADTGPWVPKTVQAIVDVLRSDLVQAGPTPPNPARVEGLEATIAAAPGWGGAEYETMLDEVRPAMQAEVERLMSAEDLDAIVLPTMECPASPRYDAEDPTWVCDSADEYGPGYLSPATGFPEVTTPVTLDSEGLPIGLSFLGLPDTEAVLLTLANASAPRSRRHPGHPVRPPARTGSAAARAGQLTTPGPTLRARGAGPPRRQVRRAAGCRPERRTGLPICAHNVIPVDQFGEAEHDTRARGQRARRATRETRRQAAS